MFRFLITFSFLMMIAPVVQAEPSLGQNLKQHQEKKENLEQEVKKIERDLGDTRGKLVDIGKSIQGNEKTLGELEQKIAELQSEKDEIRKALDEDRQSMGDLILALERIRRVPPEAMIARPEAPYKTAQSALLMGEIMPVLQKKADDLKVNLENLDKVTTELEAKRESALKASIALEGEYGELEGLVQQREKMFADTHADLEEEKANVKRISQQASNLADLVSRLKKDRQDRPASIKTPDVKVAAGQARLPISGTIRIRYDQPDSFGSPSKGISIEGRAGALVVAPMGGVVRFTGHFKNYGNIVIIEHQKGFHSLVAGLEKIDTVVGQSVSAGEALGLLHGAENPGEKPALYYELRQDGRPVNPAVKFNLG